MREEQRWIDSCVKFFRHRRIRPMRIWMFGPHANPGRDAASRQAWLDAYRAHNAAVREFFASRPHQYFEFDPTTEGRWDRLCAFLGAPVPEQPWPHANPTRVDRPWRPAWRRLKRALGLEARAPAATGED